MESRRQFIKGLGKSGLGWFLGLSLIDCQVLSRIFAQPLLPFLLKLVRDEGLPEVLNLNDCIYGKLYLVKDFSVSDPGSKIAHTLELPYRNNLNQISAIPPGIYDGSPRVDGSLGWRIQFSNTADRKLIQIHPGNVIDDTRGCILVGQAVQKPCKILESRKVINEIRSLYGNSTNSRPIQVQVS